MERGWRADRTGHASQSGAVVIVNLYLDAPPATTTNLLLDDNTAGPTGATYNVSLSDTVSGSDTLVRRVVYGRGLVDPAVTSDLVARIASRPRALSEGSTTSDSASRTFSARRSTTDFVTALDSLVRTYRSSLSSPYVFPGRTANLANPTQVRVLVGVSTASVRGSTASVQISTGTGMAVVAPSSARTPNTFSIGVVNVTPQSVILKVRGKP